MCTQENLAHVFVDDNAAYGLEASKLQLPKALPPSERSKVFFFPNLQIGLYV
jgi:hypothetical protein